MVSYDPCNVVQKLKERYINSIKINSSQIVRVVPECTDELQYIITIVEHPIHYEAQVYCNDQKVGDPIPADDIDVFIRYIMEGDKSFFDNLIEKARADIKTGEIKYCPKTP